MTFRSFQSIREMLRKTSPASHLTSFVVLHELTALLPLPIVYYTLQTTGLRVPVSQDMLDEGTRRIDRIIARYNLGGDGSEGGSPSEGRDVGLGDSATRIRSETIVDMATAYAVVKLLMPVRIAVSLALTPWFARRAVVPARNALSNMWQRIRK
ncbi:hypothetical protein CcCBS67573_g05024 [Chytriomyces confervae]|uniref:Uncharacterized protein n=1 Tax=Chytriomyces confervae TaxID=246404 RepID=A0A507FBJ3_9FUNG|nr:hypothetical protein CcCBS67573_g05024 [Chytriomyces confervae]